MTRLDGEECPDDRCESTLELDWEPRLVRHLTEQGVQQATTLQTRLWPLLTRQQSVVCIAGPEQGKPMGWALPLLHSLLQPQLYAMLPPGPAPRALVLCAGNREVSRTSALLRALVAGAGLGLVCLDRAGPGLGDPVPLINGCDVLVSSPGCLLALVEADHALLYRCRHLVVEEGERTLQQVEQVRKVMAAWLTAVPVGAPRQVVLLTEQWSRHVRSLTSDVLKTLCRPTLVFASLQEAALYRELPLAAEYWQDETGKLGRLLDILQSRPALPTVICFHSGESLGWVWRAIAVAALGSVTVLGPDLDRWELEERLAGWRAGPLLVWDKALLCLEQVHPNM